MNQRYDMTKGLQFDKLKDKPKYDVKHLRSCAAQSLSVWPTFKPHQTPKHYFQFN